MDVTVYELIVTFVWGIAWSLLLATVYHGAKKVSKR